MPNAILGSVYRIQVTFHDWSMDDDNGGALVDPDTVTGAILDIDLNTVSTFSPIRSSLGVYYYDWSPGDLGSFYLEFVGHFPSTTDTIRDLFVVTELPTLEPSVSTLGETQVLNWCTELSPMYLDPDEILVGYPDISPIEISEFIAIYSSEVAGLLGLSATDTPSFDALEYIRAAVFCALSRFNDINQGFGTTTTLGDLTVTQGGGGTHVNASNASNWCELAFTLRALLVKRAGLSGIKAIHKGDAFLNPIPVRLLTSKD